MSRFQCNFLSCAALAAAFLLAGCGSKVEKKVVPPPEVLVLEVAPRDVEVSGEWLGTLDGSTNVDIRARVSGYVVEKTVSEGTLVKAGDPLFRIDPRPLQAALAQAKAKQAESEAAQVKAALEAKRQDQLFQQKVASRQEYDNAQQVALAATATVEAAKAAVEQAQLNLDYATITSPVGGIIGRTSLSVGDLITAGGGEPLVTISTVDPIDVVFPISEADYLETAQRLVNVLEPVHAPRPRRLHLILSNGKEHPELGAFESADRSINQKTGTLTLKARFPNPGNILRPGQYGRVRAVVREARGVLVVPQRAVLDMQGVTMLAVIKPDNTGELRRVVAGDRVGSDWIIESGLKPGERVVVEGVLKVRNGAPVIPKPWAPAAATEGAAKDAAPGKAS